jgi:hypothetical protein
VEEEDTINYVRARPKLFSIREQRQTCKFLY